MVKISKKSDRKKWEYLMNLPANGTSVTYSTQSVDALRSDDTELSDPLDAFNECDIITSDEHGDKLLSRLFGFRCRDRLYNCGGGTVSSYDCRCG